MPLHVICPGCLKRFQVSVRFAGLKGPCPNCATIISIPKESVKIHGIDNIGTGKGKGSKHNDLLHPFPRLNVDLEPVQVGRYALIVLSVLLLTFVLGCIPMYNVLRLMVGTAGLCFVAFPLTLFGYRVLLDREQIFVLTGTELYSRIGIVATGYVILWCGFEYFLVTSQANVFISTLYFGAFAVLATLLVHPILELHTWDAFLHYSIFGFSITLLRFFIGLGWFWESGSLIRYSTAPPPPFLPGM